MNAKNLVRISKGKPRKPYKIHMADEVGKPRCRRVALRHCTDFQITTEPSNCRVCYKVLSSAIPKN